MSFLYRPSATSMRALRSAPIGPRLFSTCIVYRKGPVEAVRDGLKAVDRTVSDVAVAGIDKGIESKDKVADVAGLNAAKAKGSAQEVAGEAKGKASEMAGEAKGKASEMTGDAKGKAQEFKGEMKGKTEEVKSKM